MSQKAKRNVNILCIPAFTTTKHSGAYPQKWDKYVSGRQNRAPHLWDALMFQAWLEHSKTQ